MRERPNIRGTHHKFNSLAYNNSKTKILATYNGRSVAGLTTYAVEPESALAGRSGEVIAFMPVRVTPEFPSATANLPFLPRAHNSGLYSCIKNRQKWNSNICKFC